MSNVDHRMWKVIIMQPYELQTLFKKLTECEKSQQLEEACELLKTIFNALLKSVYAIVRGNAPPRIMRSFMELEVEMSGEDGDFKTFDNRQMIDLFSRGKVLAAMQALFEKGHRLSLAMDLETIDRWLADLNGQSRKTSLAAVQFVHQWMVLFAVETGVIDLDASGHETPPDRVDPLKTENMALPRPGEPFVDSVTGMTFVYVAGGVFPMGDGFGEGAQDEQPVHEVFLSPFYMAICPVTQAQWKMLMPDNPSSCVDDDHPVEQVAFGDVMAFIDHLNAASPKGIVFDLPSEAQWEFAARSGGLDELYAGGSDPETVAWIDDNTDGGTAPVGTKPPNGLGLYDMSGNVWEWCRDIYRASAYRHHEKEDPVCATGGRDRVIRGGSWHLDAWSARCSRRFCFDPELFGPALGFRLVMDG